MRDLVIPISKAPFILDFMPINLIFHVGAREFIRLLLVRMGICATRLSSYFAQVTLLCTKDIYFYSGVT